MIWFQRFTKSTKLTNLKQLEISRGVLCMAAIFWFFMALCILHRHFSFYPSFASHDQGILNQVFWNSAHGRWFEGSLSSGASSAVWIDKQVPDVSYRRLGQHFTPAHFLWLPLYALFPSSATLLALQVTLVTLAGLVLYVLARQRLAPQVALWITLSYYCATAVIGPNLANFHDLSQVPLFVFSLLLAIEKQRWRWMGLALLLVLMSREDTGITIFSIGAYLLLSRRHPWVGAGLCIAGGGYLLIVTNVVMPLFSDEVAQHFMSGVYGQYVTGDKPSTLTVLKGLVLNPGRLLIGLVTPISETVRYVLGQALPLMFVPLISPATWLNAGAPLLALLLREDTAMALSMQMRYAVTVVPGLFYGAILWWEAHPGRLNDRTRKFWAACLGLSLLFTFTLNPVRSWSFLLPDSIDPWVYVSLPRQWHHVAEVRSLLAQIPPEASLSATDHLLPHVSSRRAVLRFPNLEVRNDQKQIIQVDYIIADLWQLQQYQAAFKSDRGRLEDWIPLIDRLIASQNYGLVDYQPGVVLLIRNQASNLQAVSQWQAFKALFPSLAVLNHL
jgi:uncharacterized membrane protein